MTQIFTQYILQRNVLKNFNLGIVILPQINGDDDFVKEIMYILTGDGFRVILV